MIHSKQGCLRLRELGICFKAALAVFFLALSSPVPAQTTETNDTGSSVPIPYFCLGNDAPNCIGDAAIAVFNKAIATEGPEIYDDLASSLAETLAAIGRVDEAVGFARPIFDDEERELTFWGMAGQAATDGDLIRAAALIDEGVPKTYRSSALQGLATYHFDQNDEAGAFEVIAQIESPTDRAMSLMMRATFLARAGREAMARHTMDEALGVVPQGNRAWLMLQGVEVLVWLGDSDAAQQEVDQLSGRVRDDGLRNMASAYGELKQFDRAQEYLALITDPLIRGFASAKVADSAVKSDDLGFALALATEAPNHQARSMVLEAVARALAREKDLAGARSVFTDAIAYALSDESEMRSFVLLNVVIAMAREGFEEEARAHFGDLASEIEKEFVLQNIAVWHARSGELAKAFATTEEISTDYVRFVTLLDLVSETDTLVRQAD